MGSYHRKDIYMYVHEKTHYKFDAIFISDDQTQQQETVILQSKCDNDPLLHSGMRT